MITAVITIIGIIAIIAIVLWFVRSVGIDPPLLYVVYAGVAILAIVCIIWIMDRFGSGLPALR